MCDYLSYYRVSFINSINEVQSTNSLLVGLNTSLKFSEETIYFSSKLKYARVTSNITLLLYIPSRKNKSKTRREVSSGKHLVKIDIKNVQLNATIGYSAFSNVLRTAGRMLYCSKILIKIVE